MKREGGTRAKDLAVFIDADNLNDPTALDRVLHELGTLADRVRYRRAYGRAESLKGIESVLWKHGVRPVANLIVDKVTTDGALVIDAVEAVCTNEIDTVAICSGDADFVPLAIWLREKGCRVLCYSLQGKIFANPESFYDDVVILEVVDKVDAAEIDRRVEVVAVSHQTVSEKLTAVKTDAASDLPLTAKNPPATGVTVKAILKVLPELRKKEPVHLSIATKKLRDAHLLGSKASSPPLFRKFAAQFELIPAVQPNAVRYRG